MAFSRELLLARFMAKAVFFAGILFSKCQLVITEPDDPEIPTAATDGETIWINPKFMVTLALDEQVFILCHEVFHVMFFHCAQLREWLAAGFLPDGQPMDEDRYSKACDYVINHLLVEMGFKMPACGLIDPNNYPHTLGSIEVYKKLRTHGGGGKPGFDKHIPAPKPATAAQKQQMAATVAAAAQAAKKAGQLPAALAGLVGELINPTTPWQEVLRQRVVHSRKDESTWARPNRRRLAVNPVVMPARRGTSCGDIAAIMDTSGSIGRKEAGAFLSELKFICEEANPDKVWILWTDTQVAHADELDDPAEDRKSVV